MHPVDHVEAEIVPDRVRDGGQLQAVDDLLEHALFLQQQRHLVDVRHVVHVDHLNCAFSNEIGSKYQCFEVKQISGLLYLSATHQYYRISVNRFFFL